MIPPPDPYKVLGLTAEASSADVHQAFRALVRRHHPDTREQSGNESDHQLQQVFAAYAVLRDPASRAAYDLTQVRPSDRHEAFVIRDRRPAIRVGPVQWSPLPPDVLVARAGRPGPWFSLHSAATRYQ